MAQAYAVAEWGELAHYTYWYDHPPAGWLQLALWTVISGPDFGGNAVAAGRYLMVIVAVITAALLWVLARRIEMSRWASAAAVAVFALSPLAISLSRTVYLDNLATAWVLGALVLVLSPVPALGNVRRRNMFRHRGVDQGDHAAAPADVRLAGLGQDRAGDPPLRTPPCSSPCSAWW